MSRRKVAGVMAVLLGVTLVPLSAQSATAAPGDLPLLSDGQHYFITKGLDDWSDLSSTTEAALTSKYQAAVGAGMDVAYVTVDWAELEPSEGVYDMSSLEEGLDDAIANGQQPLVNINTFDSEELSIPAYLRDSSNPDKFRSDIGFADDSTLLAAWEDLLDEAVPLVVAAGGFAIAVGNEIDNRWKDLYEEFAEAHDVEDPMDTYYQDYEALRTAAALSADEETSHNVNFLTATKSYIHGISGASNIAVSFTLTRIGAKHNSRDSRFYGCVEDYADAGDIVIWNIYGDIENGFSDPLYDYSDDFLVESPTEIAGALDLMEDYSDGKQLIIQEAGYPAATSLNGSEVLQKAWFDTLYSELESRPNWRATGVFLMVDPSDDFMDAYIQPIVDTVPAPWGQRVWDSFRSFGFNELADGSSKLAWTPFLDAVSRVRQSTFSWTYTGSTGFSGTQGANGWNYKYWNGSSYANATYQSGSQYWKGVQTYTRIYSNILTPDTTNQPARAWVAPADGTVNISTNGNVRKVATGGDGAYALIYKNSTQLWSQLVGANDTTGYGPTLTTSVSAGDTLYFRVSKNSTITNDSLYFDPVVEFDPDPVVYTASTGFSGTQGLYDWSYKYWNGSSYANATYNSGSQYWQGSQTYSRIYSNIMTPDTSNEPARAWVAPYDGNIIITSNGNVRKVATGGDGAYAWIFKNGTPLWSRLVGASDTTGYHISVYTTVSQGDVIYFRVNKNSNITSDSLYFDPVITLQ